MALTGAVKPGFNDPAGPDWAGCEEWPDRYSLSGRYSVTQCSVPIQEGRELNVHDPDQYM